ncbi:hypothetical protein KPH14_009284 [Odynerus spinipes]|uniref:BRCT domain-containing protein n=1 Tax=Odynerus spinipes TaxID=1348599 RepID=A0AAD9VQE5_9HYME|nr:hypothetical protein KPH14_009284 [Odynerus spinipes]
MIIKFEKIISCSSEHPSYPASNLLEHRKNSSWRCAKPGEMLATVIFQLAEPSTITGVDIGNYRSCVVIVTASTSSEPETWIPIIQHQFLTHDEAANGKFRDQVQLFTKRDLNPDTLKIKFDRIKVTCMQSANLRELFGLTFFIAKTEVSVDLGLDVFGRFKLKQRDENDKPHVGEFKEKYLKMITNKKTDHKTDLLKKVKESGRLTFSKRQEDEREPMKRPLLEKLEAGKSDEVFGNELKDKQKENVTRTPFGDIVPSPSQKKNDVNTKKRSLPQEEIEDEKIVKKVQRCLKCSTESDDIPCPTCSRLPQPKPLPSTTVKKKPEQPKPKKLFSELFQDVTFSLSGYVNPQRNDIRRKALRMGAKYIADPNTTNNKCSHLICAFKNTPKYQQLKNHCKIVSHKFIEDCHDKKTRFPWRRYALDNKDKNQSESEEEIEACSSREGTPNPFEVDTDSDTYY